MSYTSEVLADNPVGFWLLNEAAGLPQDSSGNAHHATASINATAFTYSQPSLITSMADTCIDWDTGVADGGFSVPDHADFDFGDTFSLEAWVNIDYDSSDHFVIMGKDQDGASVEVWEWIADHTVGVSGALFGFAFRRNGTTVFRTSNVYSEGTTYHVVFTKNGSDRHCYVNGVEDTVLLANQTQGNNAWVLGLGNLISGTPWNGAMQALALYNTVLSSTRSAVHYTAGSGIAPPAVDGEDSMPRRTSLGSLLKKLARRNRFGRLFNGIDPDSVAGTSFTLADSYGASTAMTGVAIPAGSQVIFTNPCDSGTATSTSTTVITDSTKNWTTNEWAGFIVSIDGWRAVIASNTATALTVSPALDEAPAVGHYSVEYGSSFVTRYTPSTGAVAINPTLGTLNSAQTNTFSAVTFFGLEHAQQAVDAINDALTQRCYRPERRPLTFVPDGDLQGEVVTDYWTGTNATPAYIDAQVFPAGSAADAFGQTNINRILQSTTTNATNNVESNGIKTVMDSSTRGAQWFFQTAIRVVSGSGNVQLVVVDKTNADAVITLSMIQGSENNDATTSSQEFMYLSATFEVPEDSSEIAFRLVSSATTTVVQMTQLIAFPTATRSWPLPNRVRSNEDVGNFYYGLPTRSPGSVNDIRFSQPITTHGREATIYDYGDHKTVTFNFHPALSGIWYDEFVYGKELTGMADTTTFDDEYVIRWAAFELYDWLMRKKMNQDIHLANGQAEPTNFRHLRNAALVAAQGFDPASVHVYGRR